MDRTYLEKPDATLVALTLADDQDAYEALVRRYLDIRIGLVCIIGEMSTAVLTICSTSRYSVT